MVHNETRGENAMSAQKSALEEGASFLGATLAPHGFRWVFRGSGGWFAWGGFVREDRTLELHFRLSLGIVAYHIGNLGASHETYMQALGVWGECRYPGHSTDPGSAFERLAHDLAYAQDFLSGTGDVLRLAATTEQAGDTKRHRQLMVVAVGDAYKRAHMRDSFKAGRFADTVRLASELEFPDMMTESERTMLRIATQRAKG
jgi:hypothetical protein